MKGLAFILAFVCGSLAVAVVSYLFAELKFRPAATAILPSAVTKAGQYRAGPKRLNCVDAAADPKLRKQRLKKIDQLRKKVDKLRREFKNNKSLERELQILEETIRLKRELNELELRSDNEFGKTVYHEICY